VVGDPDSSRSAPPPLGQTKSDAPSEDAEAEKKRQDEKKRQAERRRRLLHRGAISLIVTFFGIALTAWLLPALTRQWDDRQKAHDLKAAIVSDMASATARALLLGQVAASASTDPSAGRRRDDWLQASIRLETRLRAYFPHRLVAAWQVYTYFVDRVVGVNDDQANTTLRRVINWMYRPHADGLRDLDERPREHLDGAVSGAVRLAVAYAKNRERRIGQPVYIPFENGLAQGLSDAGVPADAVAELKLVIGSQLDNHLEAQLLDFEEALAASTLNSHVVGYSTNVTDFFHNLIP
jgi:hypothetical protein